MGRADADLTSWLEYFTTTLAAVFSAAKEEALRCATEGITAEAEELRRLDRRARVIIGLFTRQDLITTADVAGALGLSERMARVLVKEWVKDGWLEVANPSNRARSYSLSASYRQFVGSVGG